MSKLSKRKICMVITNRVHYSRGHLLLDEIRNHEGLELQLLVGGSALLEKYGNVSAEMEKKGYSIDGKINMQLEGSSTSIMSKTTGLGLIEFSSHFERINPDIVLVRGDRYEVLAPVIAATYQNIPVAHIEGGDLSGTLDELVRHAITKLSHIHFVTNEDSRKRVINLGELPDKVFNFGSLDVEILQKQKLDLNTSRFWDGKIKGVGSQPDLSSGYLLIIQHPVTTEHDLVAFQIEQTLAAVETIDIPAIWLWPNIDAGSDDISKVLRSYREKKRNPNFHFFRFLESETFGQILNNSSCIVGNSSAGIKETSFLGIPSVNIGSRQEGRLKGSNVIDVSPDKKLIRDAIIKQLEHGRYESENVYFKQDSAKKIAEVLAIVDVKHQKRLTY